MEKDQEYQSKYRRSQSAPNPTYSPLQVGDATAAMQREFDRQNRDAELTQKQTVNYQKSVIENIGIEGKNAVQQAQELSKLGEFSKTLNEQLQVFVKESNERQKQDGIMEYYTNGVPQQMQDQFDEEEAALAGTDGAINSAAADVGKETGEAYMERAVRGMSGWKAYGYKLAMAQDAGINFGAALATQGKDFSIEVNGETLTFATADTLPEYQTVLAAFRRQYLAQYSDMNPAMLNKHTFPAMKKAENAYTIQWAKDQETKLDADKQNEGASMLVQGVNNGTAGQAYARFTTQLLGNYGNDPKKARDAAYNILKDMAENGKLKETDLDDILDTEDPRTGKTYRSLYDGQVLKRLRTTIIQKSNIDAQNAIARRKAAVVALENKVKELQLGRDETGQDPLSLEARKAIIKEAEAKGVDWKSSEYLQNYLSKEVEQDDEKRKQLDAILYGRGGRGFLTESDLNNASTEVRKEYASKVKDPTSIREHADAVADGEKYAEVAVKEHFKLEYGTGEWGSNTNALVTYQRAKDDYMTKYRAEIKAGNSHAEAQQAAQEYIKLRLGQNFGEPEKNPYLAADYISTDDKLDRSLQTAQAQIAEDKNVLKNGMLRGSEDYYKRLNEYATTGKGEIPTYYHRIAQAYPDLDGWDVAQAQLKANGGPSLMTPPWKQTQDTLAPDVQRLLKNFPTPSRVTRAAYGGNFYKGDNWTQFLDMVASVESESYGGYDAYNRGGSDGGHTAHGSGNSAEDMRYGKPISQLTVNEIVDLGLNNQIFAAGRYQFIPSTLRQTIKDAGLTGDELFDASTQDRLAIARARWRIKHDKGMAGLRREWIGLTNVDDAVLRPAMQGIIDDRSPYNKAENMTAGVARRVYTTGNIGPTSTGPHLDVKQVGGGRFAEDALDDYVEVNDPDFGRISLGELRRRTGGIGDNFDEHLARGSHGIDYGTHSGTGVYLKNGAKVVSKQKSAHGDILTIQLPNGKQYTFLHGKAN